MAFVKANGITIHYRLSGAANGPRVVFLNSLGSDLRIWDAVAERLGERFTILTLDKRGHGLSETTPGPYSIPLLADDVVAVLDALGWDRASIVGLSIGGLIAQQIALQAPDRLESLILMDTACRIGTEDGWNERIEAVRTGGLQAIGNAVATGWFSQSFPSARPEEFTAWRRMLESTPPEGYTACCAALRDADLTGLVDRITAPTLAMAGDTDRATTPDIVRATAERIAGARFAVIEEAGHLPCLERPDEIAALIADHVGGGRRLESDVEGTARFDAGMTVRRAVLGDAHVDRATAAITPFDRDFQRFITEGAWGSVWSSPHLTRRERSIVTLALLAALGHDDEVAMHVRATRNTGASERDVAEAMMHVAVYAGVPAANQAIKIAKRTFAELRKDEEG